MIEVVAETEIAAAPETVWSVLTEFSRFPAWNPFIRNARGSATTGDEVHVRVRPSLGVPLAFHADVLYSEKERALRWRGHVLAPWIASGDHIFSIEPLENGHVRFVQRETFGGILPRLASKLLAREAKRGFDAMNAALKARAEAQERVS
jgi:hypothetical protein